MVSYEIQNYLASKDYKLALNEYENMISGSPQITHIKLVQSFDFYFKVDVSTSDGYAWGIYVLNYDQDVSMLQHIHY